MCNNKGKCQLVPKEEVYVVIISAFQSQEFGFGYPLTFTDIQTVYEYQTTHPIYVDTYAATAILLHNHKEPITIGRNPFWQEFEYGASAKVCCAYDRMVLKLEDCIKILKVIHPSIDFIFLFDNYFVHDKTLG